jgi:hypothetical protein
MMGQSQLPCGPAKRFKRKFRWHKNKGGRSRLEYFAVMSFSSTGLLFTITTWQIEETVGIQQIAMLMLVPLPPRAHQPG